VLGRTGTHSDPHGCERRHARRGEDPRGRLSGCGGRATNRDPLRFPYPDKLNIFRKPEHRHFSFSFGRHVCIGQHLARVEMTRALNAVLDRLPSLQLDPAQHAPKIQGI
jgi:cytochrome P450